MKTHLDSDVIIAGAGPAGASAAIHLVRAGFSVILLDYQTFPRDKVCGDFVSPVALRELRKLGIHQLRDYKSSHVIREASVYLDGKPLITSAIPKIAGLPAYGRVIPRKGLDDWLVAKARALGAQVWEGCRVESFEAHPNHVHVSVRSKEKGSTLRARVLIGADGSSSLVARLLRGSAVPEDDRIIAVRGYFEGIEGRSHQAELYFSSKTFPGYYWVFPISETGANVGVGMVLKTVPANTDHLRVLLLQLIQEDDALRNRLGSAELVGPLKGWPLSIYDPQLPIVGDKVLLVGDAAGLINPLNGEGIQYALLSGAWAAEAILNCSTKGDFSRRALNKYAVRIAEEIQLDMTLARSILQLLRNRSLNPVWLQALKIITARARVDPDYAALTGGVLAGLVPIHRLATLSIIQKTVRQAGLSMGYDAFKQALLGPNHLARLGVTAMSTAVDIATMLVENRSESVQWGVSLANTALELPVQVSTARSRSSKRTIRFRQPRKSQPARKRA